MSAGRLVLVVGAIALLAVVVLGLTQAADESSAPPKAAPTLSARQIAQRLDGAPPKLAALHRQANQILPGARKGLRARLAELRGEHPVVVNIWAAWCGPCRAEMPVLQQVSLDFGKEVAFIGVDLRDNREAAAAFLRKIPVAYPSYDDPSGKVYNAEGLAGVPSTLFYDRRGKQRFVHQGPYFEKADLVKDIRQYALR
ncbi:MAG TPA: TlpA disulfide reductase family protein [Solirubrobacteraceae bacterium]|nr:TlpA disulfide reductase family protein [Solirubrobacteraceae bacterium]